VLDGRYHLLRPAESVVHVISDVVLEHLFVYNIFAVACEEETKVLHYPCTDTFDPRSNVSVQGTTNAKKWTHLTCVSCFVVRQD
jgi:hypothetical protein